MASGFTRSPPSQVAPSVGRATPASARPASAPPCPAPVSHIRRPARPRTCACASGARLLRWLRIGPGLCADDRGPERAWSRVFLYPKMRRAGRRSFLLDPLADEETAERPALLRPEIADADLLTGLLQKLLRHVERQQIIVDDQIELQSPLIEAGAMPHDSTLRRRDCHWARIDLERFGGPGAVQNRYRVGRHANGRRHD